MGPDHRYHGGAESDVWNEMTVHNVHMEPIRPILDRG